MLSAGRGFLVGQSLGLVKAATWVSFEAFDRSDNMYYSDKWSVVWVGQEAATVGTLSEMVLSALVPGQG
jgi:hypothetical protein